MTSDTRTGPLPADHSIRDHRDLDLLIEAHITRLACGRIRDLHVSCSEGRVILQGRSRTHCAKQLAQQAALDVTPGVSLIVNSIVVSRPEPSSFCRVPEAPAESRRT